MNPSPMNCTGMNSRGEFEEVWLCALGPGGSARLPFSLAFTITLLKVETAFSDALPFSIVRSSRLLEKTLSRAVRPNPSLG